MKNNEKSKNILPVHKLHEITVTRRATLVDVDDFWSCKVIHRARKARILKHVHITDLAQNLKYRHHEPPKGPGSYITLV